MIFFLWGAPPRLKVGWLMAGLLACGSLFSVAFPDLSSGLMTRTLRLQLRGQPRLGINLPVFPF